MNIVKDEKQGILVLRCEGRLDAMTAPQLEDEMNGMIDQGKIRVLLDFGRIDYLSSAGMRLLLSMTKKLKGKNGMLAICSLHEEVREIITMAGFEKILAIFPSEEEAEKSMG